jgi:O-antigen/teichoic acid export membrane protein
MSKTVIVKNTLAQLLGRVFTTGAGFIATILIARTFGSTGYGEFVTITSLIAFGYLFVDFGLNAAYIKFDEKRIYFADFLLLRLIVGIGAAMLLTLPVLVASYYGISLFSISPPLLPGLLIYSLTILTQAVLLTYSAMFQAHKRYELQAISLIPGAIFIIGAMFWITAGRYPQMAIYIAYVLSGLLSVCIGGFMLRKHFSLKSPDSMFAKQLVVKGLPLGLLLIFNLLYFRVDALLLSAMKGPIAVGIYGYGYKFFDFALTIPLFLSNALFPFLLDNQKNHRKGIVSEREFFFIFSVIGVMLGFVGIVLSPIIAFVSRGFDDSVLVLQILCASLPFFFLTSYVQWLLIARNAEKNLLWIYSAVAMCNIILNLFFIPTYSYIAAAVTTGVCEVLVLVLLLYVLHSTKNLRKARVKKPMFEG